MNMWWLSVPPGHDKIVKKTPYILVILDKEVSGQVLVHVRAPYTCQGLNLLRSYVLHKSLRLRNSRNH